jgi:hypothetical protein
MRTSGLTPAGVKPWRMGGFTSNLVANLLGTFVGAGLALYGSWWLERRSVAARERSQLQGLVDRLYRSRALAPSRVRLRPDEPLSAAEVTDRERCAESIIATRDRIGSIAEGLSVHIGAAPLLDRMYVSCLHYLVQAERPARYVDELMTLRAEVVLLLDELSTAVPSLTMREPGTAYPETHARP